MLAQAGRRYLLSIFSSAHNIAAVGAGEVSFAIAQPSHLLQAFSAVRHVCCCRPCQSRSTEIGITGWSAVETDRQVLLISAICCRPKSWRISAVMPRAEKAAGCVSGTSETYKELQKPVAVLRGHLHACAAPPCAPCCEPVVGCRLCMTCMISWAALVPYSKGTSAFCLTLQQCLLLLVVRRLCLSRNGQPSVKRHLSIVPRAATRSPRPKMYI